MGNNGTIARVALPDSSIDPRRLDAIPRRQRVDNGLQRFHQRGGDIRRLQVIRDISADGDGRRAIATAKQRVLHSDRHVANL